MTTPGSVPTPYLRVDTARLRANVARAAERAAAARVGLRPHAKTHKCVEVARLQLAAGAAGLTVATTGEAEVFAEHGVEDLFVAYPLWPDAGVARRLRNLAGRVDLAVGVDSVEGAHRLGSTLAGAGLAVLVEVDSGQHRTGVPPADAGAVAAAAAEAGLAVRGVFTFPGHAYAPAAGATGAADEAAALATAVASFRDAGLEPDVVSGGSTPTLESSLAGPGVLTELRPGVYVFGDAQQWELGSTGPEDVALTCRSTVVSHTGGRVVLDAGSKVLGADRPPWASGWGRLPAYPAARVVQLAEHHAVVDLAGAPLPPLGARVDVVPNHVCAAVNLADVLWADDTEPWPVAARGRNG
ncbi:alanine racemase [Nocardioides sp.]|uniref:alanine racemase n=1 Tax=Nocardioides sp. TaxID=35761 RepID=UPI003783FC81